MIKSSAYNEARIMNLAERRGKHIVIGNVCELIIVDSTNRWSALNCSVNNGYVNP